MRRSSAAHAHDQLGERERLGEVVVAAGVEPRQPVGQRAAGGEEEHRRVDAVRAQRLADVAPVGVGQADVEHQEVRRLAENACTASRPLAVARTSKPSAASARESTERSPASSSQMPTRTPMPKMMAWPKHGGPCRSGSVQLRRAILTRSMIAPFA